MNHNSPFSILLRLLPIVFFSLLVISCSRETPKPYVIEEKIDLSGTWNMQKVEAVFDDEVVEGNDAFLEEAYYKNSSYTFSGDTYVFVDSDGDEFAGKMSFDEENSILTLTEVFDGEESDVVYYVDQSGSSLTLSSGKLSFDIPFEEIFASIFTGDVELNESELFFLFDALFLVESLPAPPATLLDGEVNEVEMRYTLSK